MVRIDDREKGNEWLLIKTKDEYALDAFNIEDHQPIKSTMHGTVNVPDDVQVILEPKEMKPNEKMDFSNGGLKPMFAKLSLEIVDEPSWIYETKYDGYRLITRIDTDKVEMIYRNGNSLKQKYPELTDELSDIEESIIIDGEILVEDQKGISNFQLLQNYPTSMEGYLKYYVFDLLNLNGSLITDFHLVKRKELLDAFFKMYNFKHIFNIPYQTGICRKLFDRLSKVGYEGVIAKALRALEKL